MINFLKALFGSGPKVNYSEVVSRGAVIMDVRTKREFQDGHIKSSVNIPLNNLKDQLSKLNKNKPVITCCASGSRSAVAKRILISAGFSEVHNGGSWHSLQYKIRKG
jgi:rhodanese-related sulfurtransferase